MINERALYYIGLKENPRSPYDCSDDLCPDCGEELEELLPSHWAYFWCPECRRYFDDFKKEIKDV